MSTRALFAAARADAPDDLTRDAMWDRLASATGAAAAGTAAAQAGGAAKASAAATSVGMKLFGAFGLAGALVTGLGVAIALTSGSTSIAPTTTVTMPAPRAAARVQRAVAHGARLADTPTCRRDPANVRSDDEHERESAVAHDRTAAAVAPSASPADDLAEEARLLTDARTALMHGDAARALALVQATRRLGTRALEPEEMGLEARALRALGRADDAAATELVLRRRYPAHALAK
jgi:hypothetical protein